MFSDEYLDYRGVVYAATRLRERRIPFQEFLEDPWDYHERRLLVEAEGGKP